MLVVRRVEWRVRSVVKVFVRWKRASCRPWGSVCVAFVKSVLDRVFRSATAGGFSGSAVLQRYDNMTLSCVDTAEAMVMILDSKVEMSLERMSRSADGI